MTSRWTVRGHFPRPIWISSFWRWSTSRSTVQQRLKEGFSMVTVGGGGLESGTENGLKAGRAFKP